MVIDADDRSQRMKIIAICYCAAHMKPYWQERRHFLITAAASPSTLPRYRSFQNSQSRSSAGVGATLLLIFFLSVVGKGEKGECLHYCISSFCRLSYDRDKENQNQSCPR